MRRPARPLTVALSFILATGCSSAPDRASSPAAPTETTVAADEGQPGAIKDRDRGRGEGRGEASREGKMGPPAGEVSQPMKPADRAFGSAGLHARSMVGGGALQPPLDGLERGPSQPTTVSPARAARVEEESAEAAPTHDAHFLADDGPQEATATNPLVDPNEDPLSTFAIDVDTGSYTLSRRFLQEGTMPQAESVRVEE